MPSEPGGTSVPHRRPCQRRPRERAHRAFAPDHTDPSARSEDVEVRSPFVTYLGFVYGTLAALRRMKPRNRGTIVQVGSALAYRAIPLQSAYCAAKHAVKGFTESLRAELLHDGNAVHLTMVHCQP